MTSHAAPSRSNLILDAVREHSRLVPRREVNLLAKFMLKKKALPAEQFTLHLRMAGNRYKGIGAICVPVRFGTGKDFELAVSFKEMWAEDK